MRLGGPLQGSRGPTPTYGGYTGRGPRVAAGGSGAGGYHEYDYRILTPRHTGAERGNQDVKLSYYTDRLYSYAQADQAAQAQAQSGGSTNIALLEQQLLGTLETEAVTVQLAKDKGIDLSDDAITKEIADELGVPVGGPGSSFDTLYRAKLIAPTCPTHLPPHGRSRPRQRPPAR